MFTIRRMRSIILVVHNVRSAHNVGALLRTADGLGIDKVVLSGYTPHPTIENDNRLPHIAQKAQHQIHKTALGAENSILWEYTDDLPGKINDFKKTGYAIAALEQTKSAIELNDYQSPDKLILIVGNEVTGLDSESLSFAETHLQIPMRGAKESFNVATAAAIALYSLIMR